MGWCSKDTPTKTRKSSKGHSEACRSRSRSPVVANFTHSVDYIHLDGEIDIEFPMLTDEDIDCIVQDISKAGGASLGSIEKPSEIDAIQKHVEESLLFLDEEKSTLQKSENTTGTFHQKISIVLEKPESDDKVMKDVDDSLRHIEMEANDKNTGEPLKTSTDILNQDNKNDALLSDEQQKNKIEVESVTTENNIDSLLEGVNEETSNIPEIIETTNDILSLEDNPVSISDSVLNEIDEDTNMNNAQEKTSGISEQSDTVKLVLSQEDNPPSNFAVNNTDTDTVVNVSLEQKSDIPLLTDRKKPNIVSLEHNTTSDSVLSKMNKDTVMDNSQNVTCDITEQLDTITVSPKPYLVARHVYQQKDINNAPCEVIVSQEENLPSDSAVHETDAVANVSLGQKREIPLLTDGNKANIVSLEDTPSSDTVLNEINADAMNDFENKTSQLLRQSDGNKVRSTLQEDNPSSLSTLNETDTNAMIYDSDLISSDISEQSADIKVGNASHEDNLPSDNMLNETDTYAEIVNVQEKTSDISIVLHEGISQPDSLLDATDADVTMNYDSQEELGDNSKQIVTNEISNVSKEQKSPSDSMLNKTDLGANMDDTQEDISEIPQQNDEIDSINVSQEKNSSSEGVLDETGEDASINGPQEEINIVSDQNDINEISNISEDDNIILNETDTDAEINVSPEIVEQIEMVKVNNIYQYMVLNETDTDLTVNDSQEEMSEISELIDSNSMVSQENLPSDSVCKTDTDATINDSQEEINDMKTYNIDDRYISVKDECPLNNELDKKDAVVHEGWETDDKTIETSGNFQDHLKPIKKEGHENSVTEPQKDRTFVEVESKEMNSQTDEPRQLIENKTTDDKEHDKLPQIESNVEKTGLPENETHVKVINKTGQTNQKLPVKELIWEIKSIKPETVQQGIKELLQKERSQEQNVTENPTKKNPLVRAAPFDDVTKGPPAKRPRFQPVWTTNPLNDEDKPKAEQATSPDKTAMEDNDATAEDAPENPYKISQEAKKQLQTWFINSGLAHAGAKYMRKLANNARWNKAVLRMAPIPKDYKFMDVFKIIRDQTATYERDISKNIQYIHIDKYDDNFNAAYIKWRDIDKLLVIKAYQILVTTSFTVDGLVKQPSFKYDDRSIIDWNEKDKPILKDGNMVIPTTTVSTPALTPVVTPVATVAATTSATPEAASVAKPVAATVATPAETPVPKPRPRQPPPSPFINGEINYKDRHAFGLSTAFMEYHNIKPPILCFVIVNNLDMSQPIERYYRIFSAAGNVVEMEAMPPPHHDELSVKLRITFNHGLEAVQAVSMFHDQILYGRLIEVEMGHFSMKKKPSSKANVVIEGCSSVGPGLALNGYIMKDIRSNIEFSKLRASTKVELDNFKGQITALRQKLSAATFKLEQAKRDEEKRRFKEEKKRIQSQNESQNKQASLDAVSVITKAIASSVQANVMTMLGNQLGQNVNQTPSAPVNNQPSSMPQNQNTPSTHTPRAPSNWTANENTVAALPNKATELKNTATALPNTATALTNPNMLGQMSMENAFHNLGRELKRYQNPQDPYSYYASMQQAYAQYGYNMDPTLMQAHAYIQPGTSYMQPAFANVQPVPAVKPSNMPPTISKTQSMPTIVSNQSVPSKPSNPVQSKDQTESKIVLPPLSNTYKNDTVYEIQKPPLHFNKPPANVGNKTTAPSRFDVPPARVGQTTASQSKVPEIPLLKPTISQPAVKMAFKIHKPIVPLKEAKPAGIHIKIPSVLQETVPLVVQNPRTLEKNSVQRKLMKLAGKLPGEPWINKQIREMRKNSKSPERTRKSPEKIKSPDLIQKTLPKAILPRRAVKRLSRSPERRRISRSPERRRISRSPEKRRISRSPVRRNSRSPVRRNSRSPRRRSRSTEKRRVSRSPKRRTSRSPTRRRSRSPIRRRSRSTERRRISRSPTRRRSRSTERRRMSRSPKRRMSRSPKKRISRSPKRGLSKSPIRRKSKSPIRRRSRSPKRRISRSPVRRMSKSPVRLSRSSSERKGISRSRSTELDPKPTPRPAYEPDGASRDTTNLDHEDRTANYNFTREMEKDLGNTSVNFSFLPPSVTTEDLTDKMGEIGELLEVRAFGMGKALVVFKFRHDAETCIEMYNMAKVDGQTIEVRWASIDDMLDKEEKILVFNSLHYSAIVVRQASI